MFYPAHIRDDNTVQTVSEHCRESAQLCFHHLNKNTLGNTAYLAGLLHDAGKCTDKFRDYITRISNGEYVRKGSVVHTFAAVRYMLNEYHSSDDPIRNVTAEIISSAVGGHHGLFDCFDKNKQCGFTHRIDTEPDYNDSAITAFFNEVSSKDEIGKLFEKAVKEIGAKICDIDRIGKKDCECDFYLALLTRLITSAVIDADRYNTYSFMNCGKVPSTYEATKEIWEKSLENYDRYMSVFEKITPIQKARNELSFACYNAASNKSGIYRLKLPTGAGKTLSGLRFALNHAKENNKDRIFFISPLLTILEQNANEIRKAVGDDSIILEHHSDVVNQSESSDFLNRYELLTDTWNSPIVITTLVQFLNTLFSGKTSSVRRFHSLANSVIVIDEVQTVPLKMLSIFNLAVNFLSYVCNATVVLCSATEPEFTSDIISHRLLPCEDIVNPTSLKKYETVFKRNEISYKGKSYLSEIPDFVSELLLKYKSVLVVCNKKDEAAFLIEKSADICENRFHLSAGMCPEHRKSVLDDVKATLQSGKKVLCVSTQVIEAGVDISFDAVIRLCAGMDSIVQAAGRCNRNGEGGSDAPVWIVDVIDENLIILSDIADGKDASKSLVYAFENDCEKFGNSLSSDESIKFYYEKLYRKKTKDYFDYVKNGQSVYDLLTENLNYVNDNEGRNFYLHQAFKTAGELFEVFDSEQKSVIVPWGEGEKLISGLYAKGDGLTKEDIDRLKPYTVSVYKYQLHKLYEAHAVNEVGETGLLTLDKNYYDDIIGIILKKEGESVCDTLIL